MVIGRATWRDHLIGETFTFIFIIIGRRRISRRRGESQECWSTKYNFEKLDIFSISILLYDDTRRFRIINILILTLKSHVSIIEIEWKFYIRSMIYFYLRDKWCNARLLYHFLLIINTCDLFPDLFSPPNYFWIYPSPSPPPLSLSLTNGNKTFSTQFDFQHGHGRTNFFPSLMS